MKQINNTSSIPIQLGKIVNGKLVYLGCVMPGQSKDIDDETVAWTDEEESACSITETK